MAPAPVIGGVSGRLPDFPWDHLTQYRDLARSHADGIVNLSVGTPVDPTPEVARNALAAASDSPGYPTTVAKPESREAVVRWLQRRFGVTGLAAAAVLPVTGTKELIAHLPTQLGVGAGDLVVHPRLAYPTYEVGAALVGAQVMATDSLTAIGPRTPSVLWLNSPSNPTGRVLPLAHLRKVVEWCRERGTLLVSDECYLECAWEAEPISLLHPDVCDGDHTGILTVHSLSKRSNLAGYRIGAVAGDQRLINELVEVRKNLGLQLPGPQQDAMVAILDDDDHVDSQREIYVARRRTLKSAFSAAGYRIDHSEASLYLWATRDEDCWDTVADLARRGILVAPGSFYGTAGSKHVRIAFTETDERISQVAARLA